MQRIIVKNFGPLKDIDLEIKDYMIFLGPQASGKSTLAKLIYGFKEVVWKSVFGNTTWTHELKEGKIQFKFEIDEWRFIFKNYFSTILQNYLSYQIEYYFENSFSIVLTEKNGEINVLFSETLMQKFLEIEDYIKNEAQRKHNYDSSVFEDLNDLQDFIEDKVVEKILNLFVNNGFLFIPDERNINTELSTPYHNAINRHRKHFKEGFKSIEIFIKNTTKIFDEKRFNIIKKYFQKILKGDFENVDGGRISLPDGTKISLDFASSGQKEVIGILIVLMIEILKKSRDFYVIEEPEAHLFPEAQKDITYLISLLANQEGNQVIITTHSHYILGALNILINAHRIGQTNPEAVEKIIPRELWVDKNRIFAGFLENGEIKNIYDDEAEMIKIQQLNAVAGEINKDFDRLLDLEFANEEIK